ncbi:MAG TPA: LptA/OstA family protein [Chthoniobacterales bacterium]|nr:LptA/OstA family protein [Chthoniobacterales bacterium]
MTRTFVCTICGLFALAAPLRAQTAAATPAASPAASPAAPAANPLASPATETLTQIYSDDAAFNTAKRIGIFTGHVRVFDPRFNIQSDKLTVYIHKKESEGLEKAIAEGHVGVVRDKPDPNGGPPSKAVGLSEKAVYTSSDGNVVMTGSPRVQQGLDTHIATSPDTVMVINQDGALTTHGPSRTEIRQEPKANASPTPTPSSTPKKKVRRRKMP